MTIENILQFDLFLQTSVGNHLRSPVGEDTDEILREIGYSENEIRGFCKTQTIGENHVRAAGENDNQET